jgi:F-type H+-transporting ATPase subunit gamma
MPSFRELKSRIAGVQNIQQITRAMKMVAGARLRRSEQAILTLRPFASRLDGLCARFLQDSADMDNPLFEQRPLESLAVLSVASDRGLCGAYNNRIVEAVREVVAERNAPRCLLFSVGKRATERLDRFGIEVGQAYEDVFNPVQFTTAQGIGSDLRRLFLSEEVDEAIVVFAEYFSPMRQLVTVRQLLPCPPSLLADQMKASAERRSPAGVSDESGPFQDAADKIYIYEPGRRAICESLLEQNVDVQVFRALLEAQASEQGARMMAMDNATENAEDMINDLTLAMNRQRQENITRELLDVVGGAEAIR